MLKSLHGHLLFLLTEDHLLGQSVYERLCHQDLELKPSSEAALIYNYLPCHVELLSRRAAKIKHIRNWLGLILVNELVYDHEALQRLPFLPNALHKIATELEKYHSELAARLRQIADLKSSIINVETTELPETSLPYLAFPAVSRGPGAKYIIWESFYTSKDDRPDVQAKDCRASSFYHAENMANKICGTITDWRLNLSDKIGVPISGSSGALALFAWLWLESTGVELPCNIAITGEVGSNGEVRPVGELKLKIRIALSCGFRSVVVPRAGIASQAQEFEADSRVVAVDSVYDLISWFILHDPVFGARRKLFGFIQGGVAESQINTKEFSKTLGRFILKKLLQGSWPEFYAQFVYLSRSGKTNYRTKSILNSVLASSISQIIGSNKDERIKTKPVKREAWAQLFRSLVPESVYLLHLPIMLDRYKKNHSVAAFSLYHEMIARMFVQNLNNQHAISWSDMLCRGKGTNNWFNRGLRNRFQLLSWYLFTDVFKALFYLVNWTKLTHMEAKWLAQLQEELVSRLNEAGLEQAELPDFNWTQLSKRVLCTALSKTFPEYFFNQGNVTSYNNISILIFRILAADKNYRLKCDTRVLLHELACRILGYRLRGAPNQTLNKVILEKLKNDEKPEPKEVRQITHDGLLKCVKIALQSHEESQAFINSDSSGWIASMFMAMKCSGGTGKVVPDIYELDHALNDGLVAMMRAQVCRRKTTAGEYDAFKFQCLVNPGLALVSLVADFHENKGVVNNPEMSKLFAVWLNSLDESMSAQTGFRLLLTKEILYWLAGMMIANGYLGAISEKRRLDGRLGFIMGRLSKGFGKKIKVLRESDKEKILNAVNKRAFVDLLWLNLLDDTPLQETLAQNVCKQIIARPDNSKSILLLAYVHGLWPECKAWHELPSAVIAQAENLVEQFILEPFGMFNNRSIVQGLLPFIIVNITDANVLVNMGNKLGASRGFSPLAFCTLLDVKSTESPLLKPAWWQLDWEKDIYLSICAYRLFMQNDAIGLEILSDDPRVDLKNAALICRFRELLREG